MFFCFTLPNKVTAEKRKFVFVFFKNKLLKLTFLIISLVRFFFSQETQKSFPSVYLFVIQIKFLLKLFSIVVKLIPGEDSSAAFISSFRIKSMKQTNQGGWQTGGITVNA